MLQRCLDGMRAAGVDELWCLGDVTESLGGGPSREEMIACVDLVYGEFQLALLGNHDHWMLEGERLPPATLFELGEWKAQETRHGILAVHASPRNPLMEFIDTPTLARAVLRSPVVPALTLHGHTHQPVMWGMDREDEVERLPPRLGVPLQLSYRKVLLCPGAIAHQEPTWMELDLNASTACWHPVG